MCETTKTYTGAELKARREALGLDQAELAAKRALAAARKEAGL